MAVLKSILLQEKYLFYYYLFVFLVNNFTQYYFGYFPRVLYAAAYLWVLVLFVYHCFITKKYFKTKQGIISLIFVADNIICTFIYKANWRLSVMPDFAILILFLPVCACCENDEKTLLKVIWVFMIAHFLITSVGVAGDYLKLPFVTRVSKYRGRGLYDNTGYASSAALVMFCLSYYFLRKDVIQQKLSKIDLFHAANMVSHCLLLRISNGRTAILCIVMVLGLTFLYDIGRRYKGRRHYNTIKYISIAAVIVFFYIIVFSKYGPSRNMYYVLGNKDLIFEFNEIEGLQFETVMQKLLSGRFRTWSGFFRTIVQSPVYGYGLKSYGFTYGTESGAGPNAHNLVLNTLMFTGGIGLIVLIFVFIVFFRQVGRNMHLPSEFAFIMFLSAYLLGSLLDTTVLYNGHAMNLLFWIAMAYALAVNREGRQGA